MSSSSGSKGLRTNAVAPTEVARARLLGAADHDDRHGRGARAVAQALAVEEAVDAGQADVEHDRVGDALEDEALRLDRVVRLLDLDPLELERRPDELAEPGIVVDHENATFFHSCDSILRSRRGCVCEFSRRRGANA